MKRLLATAALLLASCATVSKKPATAPPWTEIPAMVLDAFCAQAQTEAFGTQTGFVIVKSTQPIASAGSLQSVGHVYMKEAPPSALGLIAASVNGGEPVAIDTTAAGSCKWIPVEKLDPRRHHDRMVVQLSRPFINPYERSEAGMMARMSLGGHDASWYWIPIVEHKGVVGVGRVRIMDYHE